MLAELGDHVVHASAWLVVRTLPWSSALRFVKTMGRLAPKFRSTDEARRSFSRLRGGTCLTRALATSARLEGSEVSIGVRREDGCVLAHAWVSLVSADGQRKPLFSTDPAGEMISAVDLDAMSR